MPAYGESVFVNCPFDEQYQDLFEALTFAIYDCGFVPRSVLELPDAGETRISKITGLIADCKLGVHDLSRTELDESRGLPRFNMPLELGIFLGAQWLRFGRRHSEWDDDSPAVPSVQRGPATLR